MYVEGDQVGEQQQLVQSKLGKGQGALTLLGSLQYWSESMHHRKGESQVRND